MRIFLIGYMGSGKSTVGSLLAKSLAQPFLDTDQEIEHLERKSIAQIFADHGESYFRHLENKVITGIIEQHQTIVVSTGGGLPCSEEMIHTLLSHGAVVYLECDASILYQRITTDSKLRPLAAPNEQQLREHLASRQGYYSRAHHIINVGSAPDKIVHELATVLSQLS